MSSYAGNWFGASPSYIGTWLGALSSGSIFPVQYPGLRIYYNGAVRELCMVAVADAPLTAGVFTVEKNGTLYALYPVDTVDTNATPFRLKTMTSIKAVRLKT